MTNWRSRELILLIAATPAILLIFALSIANCGNPITFSTFAVPLGLFAAFLAAHFAICKFAPSADNAMLPLVYMLSGIGIAFVMRLAPNLATAQLVWLPRSQPGKVELNLSLLLNVKRMPEESFGSVFIMALAFIVSKRN